MLNSEFVRKRLPINIEGRALAWYLVAVIGLLLLLGWGLAQLAPPPPPKRVIMTTGTEDGAYHRYAQRLMYAGKQDVLTGRTTNPSRCSAESSGSSTSSARRTHGCQWSS